MRYKAGLIILLFSTQAWASPVVERKETRIPILDTLDDFVGNKINDIANDFDRFFATERADDELGRSRVRIRSNYRIQERALPKEDIQFRFNLRLPYLEQRLRYEIDQDPKKKKKKVVKVEKVIVEEDGRIEKKDEIDLDERWIFTGDTSVNVSLRPRALVRGRIRKSAQTGTLIHRFVQEATWQTDADGFRNRTTLDTDHVFSEDLLFRFSNNVDWKISQKDFGTGHGPALFQKISDIEALSYTFGMSTTVIKGVWYVSNYSLAVTYRRNLYRDIAYLDLTPGIDFPKQWSFRRTPFLFAQLEFLFGNY